MIKKIVLICCVLLPIFGQAQELKEEKVPSILNNKFKLKFPKAKDIEWEKIGNLYKVEFELGKSLDYKVWFDKFGKLLKNSEELLVSELPQKIRSSILTAYTNARIDEVFKVTEGLITRYEVKLRSGAKDWLVIYDEEGHPLEVKED
ncbi:MAG: PepSY-like domain-containing protein [Taibaiella sp.]|nr:PepSY-like domain-containing protein [Taibaiella sp.]